MAKALSLSHLSGGGRPFALFYSSSRRLRRRGHEPFCALLCRTPQSSCSVSRSQPPLSSRGAQARDRSPVAPATASGSS